MAETDLTPQLKRCSKCHTEKPFEAFYMRTVNGRIYPRRQCKACEQERYGAGNAARANQWGKDHPEKRAQAQARHRAKCKALGLPIDTWAKANPEKARANVRKSQQKHRDRVLAYMQNYRATHLEELREKDRQHAARQRLLDPQANNRWLAKHPEKRREYNARSKAKRNQSALYDFTEAQRLELFAAKNYRCDYCDKKSKHLTMDHVTPLSKQGDHTLWNIVVACQSCNSKKGARPPLRPVQPLLLTLAPKRNNKAS